MGGGQRTEEPRGLERKGQGPGGAPGLQSLHPFFQEGLKA